MIYDFNFIMCFELDQFWHTNMKQFYFKLHIKKKRD